MIVRPRFAVRVPESVPNRERQRPNARGSGLLAVLANDFVRLGGDLEVVGFTPCGLDWAVGVESHHGSQQFAALDAKAHVMKVDGGMKLGEFAEQPYDRY